MLFRSAIGYARVEDDFLVLCKGDGAKNEVAVQNTSGAVGRSVTHCHCCGDDTEGNENVVYLDDSQDEYEIRCENCMDDVFYCEGENVYFDGNRVDYITTIEGDSYSLEYAENNLQYCEYNEEWTRRPVRRVCVGINEWINEEEVQNWSIGEITSQNLKRVGDLYYANDIPVIELAIGYGDGGLVTINGPAYLWRTSSYLAADGRIWLATGMADAPTGAAGDVDCGNYAGA